MHVLYGVLRAASYSAACPFLPSLPPCSSACHLASLFIYLSISLGTLHVGPCPHASSPFHTTQHSLITLHASHDTYLTQHTLAAFIVAYMLFCDSYHTPFHCILAQLPFYASPPVLALLQPGAYPYQSAPWPHLTLAFASSLPSFLYFLAHLPFTLSPLVPICVHGWAGAF